MSEQNILDLTILAEAKETMKAKFATMVTYFLEDAENYISSIGDGIAANQVEKIVSPAHTLKSSSHQMGAIKMSETAKEMEHIAREQSSAGKNDMQPFVEMLPKLKAVFIETKAMILLQ